MGTVAIVCLIISAILTAIYLFTAALPMYFRPLNADQAQLAGQKLDPSWMMLVPMGIFVRADDWAGAVVAAAGDIPAEYFRRCDFLRTGGKKDDIVDSDFC